jgi:hypothetical protein
MELRRRTTVGNPKTMRLVLLTPEAPTMARAQGTMCVLASANYFVLIVWDEDFAL